MNKIFLKRQIAVLIFIFCFNSGYAQTWNQLEKEYNDLMKNEQNELAVTKAKEIYSWVKVNESDTSIHLPISLKLIGNAFVNNDSAIVYYDFSLNILKKQKRENHIQVAKLHYNKSNRYRSLNNRELSLREAESSIQVLTYLNFPEYPFCTWPLERLGFLYSDMRDYKKAETYHLQALEIRKKVLGEEHPDYAASLNNLGNLYSDMGDFKKAETYHLQSLAIKKKVLGEEHPNYALSLNNLGALYSDIGDYKKAEPYYLQALAIQKKVLG